MTDTTLVFIMLLCLGAAAILTGIASAFTVILTPPRSAADWPLLGLSIILGIFGVAFIAATIVFFT